MAYPNFEASARRTVGRLPGILGLTLLLAGCTAGDPLVNQATAALNEQAAKNPDHAAYVAALVAAADSPQGRQLLLTLIEDPNNQIARAAVKAVIDDPPAESREALRRVFDSRRGLLKLDSGIALARLGDEEAFEWVKNEVLSSGGGSMTLEAFKLLASRGLEAELTPIVTARMQSDEPSIRNEAYIFLGTARQPWATRLLAQGLGKEFGAEREQAIVSLGSTHEADAAPIVEKFVNTRGLVFASIEALGDLGNPNSIPVLKKSLESDTALVQLYAAVAIWKLGDEQTAVPVLEPMVGDESADLRNNLAQQLDGVTSPKAAAMLMQLAQDEDAQVRLAAIRALGTAKAPEAAATLTAALEDKSYQVQTSALDALASGGGPEVLEAIAPLLENRNPYVVMSAANAVLAIRGRSPAAA